MTDKDPARAVVEQRHRDAAADLLDTGFRAGEAAEFRDGWYDESEVVQAFARFERDHMPASPSPAEVVKEWRCYHCGDVFTDESCARKHFGPDEGSVAACVIKAGAEQGLLGALRRVEAELADAWHAIHSESTDAAKAYYAQQSRHQEQMRLAEEAGYEKGLADGRALAPTTARPEPVEGVGRDKMAACMAEIHGHAKMANDVIRLGRGTSGNSRIKIATCLHHIERLANEALSLTPTTERTEPVDLAALEKAWSTDDKPPPHLIGTLPANAGAGDSGEALPHTKRSEANAGCWAKAKDDEPMFIILGRDPDGANIVRLWAERRIAAGDAEHGNAVLPLADAMDAWREAGNRPQSAPDPDAYPALSTAAGREGEIVERCAKIADDFVGDNAPDVAFAIAEAIRAQGGRS